MNLFSSKKPKPDLIDLLNDQTVDASKIRVGLIRKVTEQLGINSSSIRLNWIEKFNRPNGTATDSVDSSSEDDLDDVLNGVVDDGNYYNSLAEPEFVSDDLIDLKSKLTKSNGPKKNGFFNIMVSFSDYDLLEMQKSYFNLLKSSSALLNSHRVRLNDLRNRFYLDCEEFFERIHEKHDYRYSFHNSNVTLLISKILNFY
jgi:hypothetical protein